MNDHASRPLARIWRVLDTLVDWLSSLTLILIVIISFAAVISRYLLNDSLTWSEELTRYLFIWLVFVGAAISVRMRANIAVDIFAGRVGKLGERVLNAIELAATVAYAAFVGIPGLTFVAIGMSNLSPALELPMGLAYAAPVVGSVLILIYAFRPADVPATRDNLAI